MRISRSSSPLVSLLVLSVFACSSTDETPTPSDASAVDGSTPDASAEDSGSVDGGTVDADAAVTSDSSTSDVVVRTDVKLTGFVHPIDLYVPPGATRVVVFLHGGGGSKSQGAEQLGLRIEAKDGTVTYDKAWLLANRIAFVIPQGQAPNGQRGYTWTNYVMTSGVDDIAFLTALTSAIRGGTLDSSLPALPKIAVAGHSNGGMMTNRLWCEAPNLFDAFVSFAGPASVHLGVGGDHACAPSARKPYLGYVGDQDTVLQTSGKSDVATWTVAPTLANTPGFVDPDLVNEAFFHREVRVPKTCAGVASDPVTVGPLTTFSDCSGKIRLVRVQGADHCLSGALCTYGFGSKSGPSIGQVVGKRVIDLLAEFFVAQVP